MHQLPLLINLLFVKDVLIAVQPAFRYPNAPHAILINTECTVYHYVHAPMPTTMMASTKYVSPAPTTASPAATALPASHAHQLGC